MGTVIVTAVLVLIMGLTLRSMCRQRNSGNCCMGDCSSCRGKGCRINWDRIRKGLREQE